MRIVDKLYRRLPDQEIRDATRRAFRAYASMNGKPPGMDSWRGRPSKSVVVRVYGSWSAAVADAGFEPRTRGGESMRKDDESRHLQARVDAGEKLGEIAADLGISGQALGRRLANWRARHPEEEHVVPYSGWRK